MLSEEAIKEYQELYFREFGIRLSSKEAAEQASDIIRLYKTVFSTKGDDSSHEKKDC